MYHKNYIIYYFHKDAYIHTLHICVYVLKLFFMLTDQVLSLNTSHTILAHQKEMNCVTISPNDKLIATASQDKTAKVYHCINHIYLMYVY